jgi:hypothetical protein
MKKNKESEKQPLCQYWVPPADRLVENGVGRAVACLATTFEFDAAFFEEELLPRFLGLRFDSTENERTFIIEREEALCPTRVAVLVEASKLDPGQTTLYWDQIPIQVPGGVQHGKLSVLVWERLARLIVGSANLTRQGYRRNRELFAALDFFDASDSAPLKILHDALAFLDALCNWSRSLPAATQRIRETTELIRNQIQRWSRAPQDFRPRERPRASLVVGHPANSAGPARSVLEQIIQMWLPRRIVRLTVVTPFVGQADEGGDPLIARMRAIPMALGVEGWLVVPKTVAPEGEQRPFVPLPQHFGKSWKECFRQNSRVLAVPACVEGMDERPREFHAKAVLIEGDSHDLMMIGSSNFTPHGMGVGAFNCEVNLVFEDWADQKREGKAFDDRLDIPISWDEAVGVDDVVWQDTRKAPEDAPPVAPHIPLFFEWVSYSQKMGEICIGLDRTRPEPTDWSISLFGNKAEDQLVLFSRTTSSADATTLSYCLDEKGHGAHITALRVNWVDRENGRHEGFLSVGVRDRDADLLPPEEFRGLTLDGIIECLLSGRTPAEWVERQKHRKTKGHIKPQREIESLKAVDTTNYLLYRMKRLGKALAAMSERIVVTALTPDAIRYKLLRDPLGPIHLAKTLCSQDTNGSERDMISEDSFRLYALAEIALSVGYAGHYLRGKTVPGNNSIISIFAEACKHLQTLAQAVQTKGGIWGEELTRYVDEAFAETAELLQMKEED